MAAKEYLVITTPEKWEKLRKIIAKDHPPSVLLIRSKMREVLGFTDRLHKAWITNDKYAEEYRRYHDETKSDFLLAVPPIKGHTELQVHLDFYDEHQQTMFLIKYAEYLND